MLPPVRIPKSLLRYLRPALTIAVSAAVLARIIDALYRPRAVIVRADQRLLLAAVFGARPSDNRLFVYRTIDRRGVENEAFDLARAWLSPNGNMVAVSEFEYGPDFHDVILEILSMRTGTSLFYATDVSYPTRIWLATDADAPPFVVAAQAAYAAEFPDWTGVLDARFFDEPSNDIRLIDWIAEGAVVGGNAAMRVSEVGLVETVGWWRAMGRDSLGQLSVVLAQGLGAHPYTPLPAPTPAAVMTVGAGTPDHLLIDGVRQTSAKLAPGVRFVSGAW